jgi:hypothetical protein
MSKTRELTLHVDETDIGWMVTGIVYENDESSDYGICANFKSEADATDFASLKAQAAEISGQFDTVTLLVDGSEESF